MRQERIHIRGAGNLLQLSTAYNLVKVPNISNDALDAYASAVVYDALPKTLDAPAAFDVAWFIEFYLGLHIEYKRISGDRRILAMTAFDTGFVQVYDEYGLETLPLAVYEGTVIIDPVLMEKRNLARRRFTFMHESAHWLIHRKAFDAENPFGTPGVFENQYLAAKEGRIDYCRGQKERTNNDRIERQADFLASAMLMPRETLRMAYADFFQQFRERPRRIVRGKDYKDACYAELLPEYVAERFGVSKRAAMIRLEKLGAIIGRQDPRRYAW